MKFNTITIVSLIASSVFLSGCGDDKTQDQIQYERQKELLAMKLAHEREMARIEVQKEEAGHKVSNNYIENEYENELSSNGPQKSYNSDLIREINQQINYTQTSQEKETEIGETQSNSTTDNSSDDGFGVGSMLLAAGAGALTGYVAGEMLDNGMRSYQDDNGNTHYTDKNGKPITKAMYEEKKKTSKVTQFKEKAKSAGAKAKELGKKGIDKTKSVAKAGTEKVKTTYNNVKSNPKVQKAVTATKYQAKKAKVMSKKAVKKAQRSARKVSRKNR